MIGLTIDMPRWIWWLAVRCRLAIALEVQGEVLAPFDLVQHGRPLTLLYGGHGSAVRRHTVEGLSLPGSP